MTDRCPTCHGPVRREGDALVPTLEEIEEPREPGWYWLLTKRHQQPVQVDYRATGALAARCDGVWVDVTLIREARWFRIPAPIGGNDGC